MARVLIVRVGAMGDVLHALPAVAALKRTHPDWSLDWVVDERWAALLQTGEGTRGVVDAVHTVPIRAWKRRPLGWSTLADILALRSLRGRYDFVVDMQGTLRSGLIGWMAGRGRLAGYADPREPAAAWLYARRIARNGMHVVEQGRVLLQTATGTRLTATPAKVLEPAWAGEWANSLLAGRKVCLLCPGAGWAAKRWPAERFAELARQMHATGFACVVNASSRDDALAAEVIAHSGGTAELAVCNVAGLIALVRRAHILVGGDSGPAHLAAMLGVPLVALFGPTDPARNGPWGPGPKAVLRDAASPTSYKRSAAPDPGLQRIGVAQVVEAVHSVLAEL